MNDMAQQHPEETIGTVNKGLGTLHTPTPPERLPELGWNLLREDLSLPTAVLYQEKLVHNRDWMQTFINAYGHKLAPHGKTTMAPKLFHMQLQGGAWGITLATAQQAAAAYAFGVRRILLANQLVGKQNMETIARLLEDAEFEFFCLVDSCDLADQLGHFFQAHGKKLNVLLELGVEGGRAGIRNAASLQAVVDALHRWKGTVVLCGLEVYEGVLKDEAAVRDFLRHAVQVADDLAGKGEFARDPVILSGAGSAWYDVVAEEFARADLGVPVDVVLRPGCYLTHDVGVYRAAQARIDSASSTAQKIGSSLQPALQLWAYVQSIPEAGLAILGLGKRDAAFDAGLPTPALHYRPGTAAPADAPAAWQLTRMMDQHAYLEFTANDDVKVGDMIGFDISHPCLTFDKWRYLPVVDASYQVVDVVQTFF